MIDLTLLKEYIGDRDSRYDALLGELEKQAVADVERYTESYFGGPGTDDSPTTRTEYVNGAGVATILLDSDPNSVTSVAVRGVDLSGRMSFDSLDTWTTIQSSHYFTTGNRLVYLLGGWPPGEANVRVVYTVGYEPGEEPADIRAAVLDLVAHRFASRKGVNRTEAEVPNESDFPPSVLARLDRWKKRNVQPVPVSRLMRS